MQMNILVFKHVPFEGPAAIADWAGSRGHTISSVDAYAGTELAMPDSYDMLVVMGGPMNIYEEDKYPWLVAEKAAIRAAIDAGKYVVGVCLGAQLIADVLDAPVIKGKETEIGWFEINRTAECPDGFPLPDSLRVYHWHGETFHLPEGAVHIASGEACTNQGFLYDGRVLALQCHLETTRESMNALIEACEEDIHSDCPCIQTVATMRAEPDSSFDRMQAVLFRLLDHITERE